MLTAARLRYQCRNSKVDEQANTLYAHGRCCPRRHTNALFSTLPAHTMPCIFGVYSRSLSRLSYVCCCCCCYCVLLCSLGIYAFGVLCFSVHFGLAMLCALCIFSMAVFNVMVVYFVCWVSVRLYYMAKLSVASAIAMVMPTLKLNSKLKLKPKAKEAKVLMRWRASIEEA